MNALTILQGDSLEKLRELPDESIHCCVTSPPYWGLRDYGTGQWEGGDPLCEHLVRNNPRTESSTLGGGKATTGHQREGFRAECPRCGARRVDRQIGLEPTPEEYVAKMVAVFREVRRVLRSDGTCWVNLGDSYAASGGHTKAGASGFLSTMPDQAAQRNRGTTKVPAGFKTKDLIGIPWRTAFALQADGWWLRQDIIWHKPNPMPESVRDRCTKAHEYLFMLAKSQRYYYDADAIAEPSVMKPQQRLTKREDHPKGDEGRSPHVRPEGGTSYETRNRRSVWSIPTRAYSEAHFATFPPALVEPCILAGCPVGGTVLDPFAGSGTVGNVALNNARFAVLIELNPDYISLIHKRCCVEPLDAQPQALPLAAQQLTTPQRT